MQTHSKRVDYAIPINQPTNSVGRLQMVFSWMHWKNRKLMIKDETS